MKIAVVGAGNVGAALGTALIRAGHDAVYGVRDPSNPRYRDLDAARVKLAQDAVDEANLVVLATPWAAAESACRELGGFPGRIVVDCTNPLRMGADGLELELGFSQSGGECVQGWCPAASVFKTFNQVGFETLAGAGAFPERPAMFVAGDDAAAKPAVLGLVRDLGFEAVDAGPLKSARLLEPYAMLWITLAMKQGFPRNFAFGLIRLDQKAKGSAS